MTELKNMMAQVLKGQLKHINAIEGMSDANEDPSRECMGDFSNEANEEDVNYIGNYGNKGYNPSYRPNPNMSYRNPNVENPQDQVYPPRYPQQQRPPYQSQGSQFQPRQGYEQRSSYPPKEPYASSPNQAPPNQQGGRFEGILQQIMDGQKRNSKEMYEKMDTLFSNLNTKYDAVATHVKKLETQVTQTMEAVKRQEAESKKSFCNSAAIEERFEDQVPEWMLSKPTVDCMIWPEENYPERESNRARKRRLFPKIIPKTDNSGKFDLCLVSSKIGNCSIPTDFQIVEMRESSHRPLIFGTPFLSTVGAIFDFPNQRISFNKVNKGMFFPMCSTRNSFVDMVQEEKSALKSLEQYPFLPFPFSSFQLRRPRSPKFPYLGHHTKESSKQGKVLKYSTRLLSPFCQNVVGIEISDRSTVDLDKEVVARPMMNLCPIITKNDVVFHRRVEALKIPFLNPDTKLTQCNASLVCIFEEKWKDGETYSKFRKEAFVDAKPSGWSIHRLLVRRRDENLNSITDPYPLPQSIDNLLGPFEALWSIWDVRSKEGFSSTGHVWDEGKSHLEVSSTIYSTNRSSFSTRPAKFQLDRAEESTVKPEKCCFPFNFPLTLNLIPLVKIAKKSQNGAKESNHQVPKSRAPNLHFSLKTKPEHPKYDRIFMPSRRPKVMILIWKDRYLSHDPRRSGKRSFGSLVGPELIFYQDMSDERLSRAHGDFDGSRGPRYRAQGLGSS
ncbi:unnamed protein product [Microthlaspi erraticum]|uniref:Uncharacterized protein n=1 Tax=Microthlaspi erraticum TaxID=1685480 RepID=A0A6D2JF71_9BRAS|nr:unnamed protein product [Microthlaspi erraticum]